MDTVFFILELVGVVAFALSGAMLAIQNEMDIFGVCVIGAITAVGGGIIRDVLLGITPPTALVNCIPILISILVSIAVFLPFSQKFLRRKSNKVYDTIMLIADSIGLGIFTVMGVNICFSVLSHPPLFLCICLGVVTGVGGGVLRDMMVQHKPYIFVKHFYACAAIIGATLSAILRSYIDEFFATLIGFIIIVSLRLLAARFRWKLPKYSCFFEKRLK